MSNIHQALGYLFQRIEALEASAHAQEVRVRNARKQQPQQDLFAAQKQNNVHVIDPNMLARKLDVAIEKVEQVLREG